VCAPKNFIYEKFAGSQPTGWVLGSHGYIHSNNIGRTKYCPSFRDGTKITVHLDMIKRTLAYTVNGIKYLDIL